MKKKIVFVIAVLLLAIVSIISLAACSKAGLGMIRNEDNSIMFEKYGKFNLVFSDEFEGTEINKEIWNVGYGKEDAVRRGAYYRSTEEYAFVKDGNLTIRTKYIDDGDNSGWRTSWLDTKTKSGNSYPNFTGYSSKYGYYEVRCIAPPCEGIWSAFWLWPDEGTGFTPDDVKGGQDGAEIDIMESAWYNKKDGSGRSQMVIHIDNYKDKSYLNLIPDRVPKMHTEFHTFGVLWSQDCYIYYIDGKPIGELKFGVSDVKEHLILSVEVGGKPDENGKPVAGKDWAGNPNSNDKTKAYDFIIDYVRVYQSEVQA